MRFSIRVEGLDKLKASLGELKGALRELDGQIAAVRFNPNDEESIQAAIQSVNEEIDRRLLPFKENKMIQDVAVQFKDRAAKHIRSRADKSRSLGTEAPKDIE